MTKTDEEKLKKLGYRVELDYLLEHLPDSMWITVKEKNFKKKAVSFVITRHDKKWVITLSASNDITNEIYILERIVDNYLIDAVGKMILFMEESKMLEPLI